MRRAHFIGATGAAMLAGCNSSSGGSTAAPVVSPATATPAVTGLTPPVVATPVGGSKVSDLRFGQVAIPATSAATGYDPTGDAKALMATTVASPATSAISGTQLIGSYATDEQYYIRVPDAWNGKLVVIGTPSFRSAFASDAIWGDFLMMNGFAIAASNKGIPYNTVVDTNTTTPTPQTVYSIPFDLGGFETKGFAYRLGALYPNKKGIAGWNLDFATITVAAQQYLSANFKAPTRTYAVGLSNGGAQVRSLLENYPQLVDGGVDWSGVFWSPNASILDYMPKFMAAMQTYVTSGFTDAASAAAIQALGYPADLKNGTTGHPSLWFDYYAGSASFYTDLTVFAYALLNDPNAFALENGNLTPNPVNPVQLPGSGPVTGLSDPRYRAAYVPSFAARNTIAGFQHTGKIGKPLISIAGSADMFITPQNNFTPYLNAVNAAGKGALYRQYLVSGGTHVDTFAAFGYGLQPQVQFAWQAFTLLQKIVETGATPAGAGVAQTVTTPSQIA